MSPALRGAVASAGTAVSAPAVTEQWNQGERWSAGTLALTNLLAIYAARGDIKAFSKESGLTRLALGIGGNISGPPGSGGFAFAVEGPGQGAALAAAATGDPEPPMSVAMSMPAWLRHLFAAGNQFNEENRHRYQYNEVEVEGETKNYRVDSYDRKRQLIVSRKFSQLADVQPETAKGYIRELSKKYYSGVRITDSPFNPAELRGKIMTGRLILEVPPQKSPVPHGILDAAAETRVKIVDTTGKVYTE